MTRSPPRDRLALGVFLLVAFALPWTAWTLLGRLGWDRPWSMPLFVLGGAFCSGAGVLALCLQHGRREGLRRVAAALRRRANLATWALALGWAPAWLLLSYALHAAVSGTALAWRPALLTAYFSGGVLFLWLTGPLGEELGWRAFLQPWLQRRLAFGPACLVLGLVWAVWHTPLMWSRWSATPAHFGYFTVMVCGFALMLGWAWWRGGLLPVLLLHWMINASQEVLPRVVGVAGDPGPVFWACSFVVLAATLPAVLWRWPPRPPERPA
jgi:membrane protease YdiL (CAAX protease family)